MSVLHENLLFLGKDNKKILFCDILSTNKDKHINGLYNFKQYCKN